MPGASLDTHPAFLGPSWPEWIDERFPSGRRKYEVLSDHRYDKPYCSRNCLVYRNVFHSDVEPSKAPCLPRIVYRIPLDAASLKFRGQSDVTSTQRPITNNAFTPLRLHVTFFMLMQQNGEHLDPRDIYRTLICPALEYYPHSLASSHSYLNMLPWPQQAQRTAT